MGSLKGYWHLREDFLRRPSALVHLLNGISHYVHKGGLDSANSENPSDY